MQLGRLIRHAAATHWRTRMLFPASTLDAIEQAIGRAEQTHHGEIRFAIETSLTGTFEFTVRTDLDWKLPRAETPTRAMSSSMHRGPPAPISISR